MRFTKRHHWYNQHNDSSAIGDSKEYDEFYIVSIFRRHLAVLQWWLETAPGDEAREMGLLLYSCNQICHDEGGSIEDILCDPIPSLTYQAGHF